jgi:dolichol-phosphate mannosyltransferase
MDNFSITCSIVIPIYNEEGTIPELWRYLEAVIQKADALFEVIFVDDGSSDKSYELIRQLCLQFPFVRALQLSRNFGHQCALSAGIDYATGNSVILMDGDLQDAPAAIPEFIRLWQAGYDVVYAIRKKRKENIIKRFCFWLFYRVIQSTSKVQLPVDAGVFSLMDRRVVDVLRSMPERNRYITGLRAYAGFNQTGIPVERGPRYSGKPRVTLSKLIRLALDGIISFSTLPLRFITYMGIIFALTAFSLGIVGLVYKFILGQEFLSWPFGLTTTFFMGGIQLIFLGIMGEYIGRIYDEVKQRPYYVVREAINFKS